MTREPETPLLPPDAEQSNVKLISNPRPNPNDFRRAARRKDAWQLSKLLQIWKPPTGSKLQ